MFGMIEKPRPTLETDIFHFEALSARKDQWAIKYLYDRLGIIDSKMSSLLRVNGIIMGFVTVAVFKVVEKSDIISWPILFLSVCIAIFILLAWAEIMGTRIFYLAFDRISPDRPFDVYRDTTIQITLKRERQYRFALWTSAVGMGLFILLFMAVAMLEIYSLSV
ncbi:hypothetical protein [Aquabacter spiritensis]|uniref:Uncharacterized protein n=1 Tax=Aquabacter spiritensis TaxID=933073 RepID=A0A4V2UXD9_9HYPH|nr:hypothetical protein [Aquabacter spiritensis]TCT03158.1 hypothetical protein EDC64_11021 [Aquabacter spiritensis]